MGKYVLAYKGGSMAETPEAQEKAMQAWMGWFGALGSAIVDGGNPFGASTAVQSDGSTGARCSSAAARWRSTRPSRCSDVRDRAPVRARSDGAQDHLAERCVAGE